MWCFGLMSLFLLHPLQYDPWWKGFRHKQFDDVARVGEQTCKCSSY